jgi:hypothetical protein
MLLLINTLASVCLYVLLKKLYQQCPNLAAKPQYHDASPPLTKDEATATPHPSGASKTLLSSGCAGALISFSCLFLTVLSFGSIMIVYLRWSGLPDHYIGLVRGLSSLVGFMGALLYPYARQRLGLFRTGEYWCVCVCVYVCVYVCVCV